MSRVVRLYDTKEKLKAIAKYKNSSAWEKEESKVTYVDFTIRSVIYEEHCEEEFNSTFLSFWQRRKLPSRQRFY